MKKDPSLKSQASAIFIGSLAGTIFQLLIPVIIVRLISQEDFGIFRQFTLVAGTFTGLLGMGYSSSLYYFYPTTDWNGKQKIIQQTQLLLTFNLLLFIILFYFYGEEILTYLNFKNFIVVKWLVVLCVVLDLLSSGVVNIFTLEKNTLLNKIYPPIEKIVRFFIFLIIILLIPGFKGPIIALIVFVGLRLVYYLIHILPYLKKIYKVDLGLMKQQLVYSLPFGLALILNLISNKFDKFFINQYITPEEFAIYSIAFLSIPVLKQFYRSVNNVVVPEISIYMKNNKIIEATKLWQKTVDKISGITIPAVILFWILAKEIITILYTVEYVEAANYYRIFILMFFVSMFSQEIILRGSHKTKYILVSNIIGAIITIVVGFFIIQRMGLYGAIITALVGTVTPMIISLNFERRIMNLKIHNWVNWKKMGLNFFSSLLVGLPIFFFKDYIENIYLRTILVGVFFVSLIILIQMRLGIFIFPDKVNELLKKIRK